MTSDEQNAGGKKKIFVGAFSDVREDSEMNECEDDLPDLEVVVWRNFETDARRVHEAFDGENNESAAAASVTESRTKDDDDDDGGVHQRVYARAHG